MIRESFLNYSKNRRMNTEKININDEPEKIDMSSRDEKILLDLRKEKVSLPEEEIRIPIPTPPTYWPGPDEEKIREIVLKTVKVIKWPRWPKWEKWTFKELTRDEKISIMGRSIKGDPGQWVPPGGTTSQSLVKKSNADYDTEWQDTPEWFSGSYNDLSDVPSTFTPSAHTHSISDVTWLSTALDNKVDDSEKWAPNGVATLWADGKLTGAQIPVVAISEYLGSFTNTTAALANAGVQAWQRWDWFTVDTGGGQTWIITTDSPTTLSHITKVATPTDTVLSVTNSDGTLTVSPTTGNVVASLNLAHANDWTATQKVIKTALGATTADWFVLDNTTAATISVMQASPSTRWRGRWFLTNTSASYPVDFTAHAVWVANTTAYGILKFRWSGNGGAYQDVFNIDTSVGWKGFEFFGPAGSNSTPGTTRTATWHNSGANTYFDFVFSGTRRLAIGVTNSGEFQVFSQWGNHNGYYDNSGLYAYNYRTAFVHAGHGSFAYGVHAWAQANSAPPSKLTSHGRIGWKTVFLNTNTTLDDTYYVVIANWDLNNTCTGTPTYNCSHWTNETDCNLRNNHWGNCSWYAGSDCSAFNSESGMSTCLGTSGCTAQTSACTGWDESTCLANDDSYGGSCSWGWSDCSGFDESTCGSYSGSGCTQNYSDCSSFNWNADGCTGQSGCSISSSNTCPSQGDESSCTSAGCTWDWMSCTGDNSTCSGTYFTGCTGTYYTCTGTYYTWSCTGTYGASCSGTSNCSGVAYADCTSEAWCSQSSGLFLTFPNEWAHSVWFYAGYKIYNIGTTATVTMVANTGQGILWTATIAPGVSRAYDFAWIQNSCGAYSGTDSTTCTTGHPGCSWTSCSGLDETTCNGVGGQCSWDSMWMTCIGTGNCDGTWTPVRHWIEF